MPQNNLQEKLNTVRLLKERLVHLRDLVKRAKALQNDLLLEDMTLSGTHVLEKLKEKVEQVEGHLYKAINDLLPRELDCLPVDYIGTVDLTRGYVPLYDRDQSCSKAFVLLTGSIDALEKLEPETENTI